MLVLSELSSCMYVCMYVCMYLCMDNSKGFAMGCIEGRVAVEYFDELQYKSQPRKYFMLLRRMYVCMLVSK